MSFKIMAETFSNRDRRILADVDSELRLRSIEPPYDRVSEALKKLDRVVNKKFQELEQDKDA